MLELPKRRILEIRDFDWGSSAVHATVTHTLDGFFGDLEVEYNSDLGFSLMPLIHRSQRYIPSPVQNTKVTIIEHNFLEALKQNLDSKVISARGSRIICEIY